MLGKVVVITGATSGIGRIAAERLAAQGARMIIVARDQRRAERTLGRLREIAPGKKHQAHIADLSSLDQTKLVGDRIVAEEPRIDVLINNAGNIFLTRAVTRDGLERTFALNHMAYFVLTQALRERLIASSPARIVSTSSTAHQGMNLDFDDLQSAEGYRGLKVYGRSKLANILFTREIARRLVGTGVTANCFHPGAVATRFGESSGGFAGLAIPFLRPFFFSPEKGADTLVYLASSLEVEKTTGEYFVKRKTTQPSLAARDDAAAKRLWVASEALTGARSPGERAAG